MIMIALAYYSVLCGIRVEILGNLMIVKHSYVEHMILFGRFGYF